MKRADVLRSDHNAELAAADAYTLKLRYAWAEFPTRSDYVRDWWLPVLGPTATAMLQVLNEHLGHELRQVSVEPAYIAERLGVGHRGGTNSPLVKSIIRLAQFSLVDVDGTTLTVPSHMPALDTKACDRLSPTARLHHDHALAAYRLGMAAQ